MGYTTTFQGRIGVTPPLNPAEIEYLNRFSTTRRMDRENGPYYANPGSDGFGQDEEPDILNYNNPADGQPSLWCQWVPTEDGTAIVWDGGEKFYESEEWMTYVVNHFIKPNGHAKGQPGFEDFTFDHVCNGVIYAQGEEMADRYAIVVRDNRVHSGDAKEYLTPDNQWVSDS
jgi:hypothetical protein